MTGKPYKAAFLRQIFPQKSGASVPYALTVDTPVVIGRDPRCQIVLDSQSHGGVSRQHARISPASEAASGWQICDLNSANGTFINGQRLQGCRNLYEGDRITLAQDGPQFVFELKTSAISPESATPPRFAQPPQPVPPLGSFSATHPSNQPPYHPPDQPSPHHQPDSVTFSQLFPIVSTGRDLTRKAALIPGVLTVAFVVLMFRSLEHPAFLNLLLLAFDIAAGAYYFVYQLCGKQKPWWLLLGAAFTTVILLLSPVLDLFILIFRGILPGAIPQNGAAENFFVLLSRYFFGAGLLEELLKALPVFLVYFWGTKLRSPKREQIGVWEPLDGILLGTASAVGFTLLETLGQYIPALLDSVPLQVGEEAAQALGIQLLIPRILGSIFGHMAYSGYFGYSIGLSVLKPRKRWQTLGVGYLTAASLHALWNAAGSINFVLLAVIGIISYAFLAAAILKARALSPNRSQNFATRFTKLP